MWSAPHSLFRSCTSRVRWTFCMEAFDRYRKSSYNNKKCFSAIRHHQVPKFVGLMTTSSVEPLKWITPGMVSKQLTLTEALWYVNVMGMSKYGDRNATICIQLRLMTFSQRTSPSASHPLHTFRFRQSTHWAFRWWYILPTIMFVENSVSASFCTKSTAHPVLRSSCTSTGWNLQQWWRSCVYMMRRRAPTHQFLTLIQDEDHCVHCSLCAHYLWQ